MKSVETLDKISVVQDKDLGYKIFECFVFVESFIIIVSLQWGIYADPIFTAEGGWPKELSEKIAVNCAQQGFSRSRLPEFTEEEKAFVRGTYDFFGVNHYTTLMVSATEQKQIYASPSMMDDTDVGYFYPEEYPASASPWLKVSSFYYSSLYKTHSG